MSADRTKAPLFALAALVVGALVFLVVSLRKDPDVGSRSAAPAPASDARSAARERPALATHNDAAPRTVPPADANRQPVTNDWTAPMPEGMTREQELAKRRSDQVSLDEAVNKLRYDLSRASSADPKALHKLQRQLERLEKLTEQRRLELERLKRDSDR